MSCSYLFDIELSFTNSAYPTQVAHSSLLINWLGVRIFLIHAIFASLQCAEITTILFNLSSKFFFAAKARSSYGYDLLFLFFSTTTLFFNFNLGLSNPKDGIILSEIELTISDFNILLSVLLKLILVDVRHNFETVRKHVRKLVLVNN